MIKLYYILVFGFALTGMKAVTDYTAKVNTAEVAQVDGLYIFVDALPVKQYKTIGELDAQTFTADYNSVRDKCIKKTKEQYPLANAVLISFNGSGRGKCTAIHIEE